MRAPKARHRPSEDRDFVSVHPGEKCAAREGHWRSLKGIAGSPDTPLWTGGGKSATGNQTATILVEGEEYNVRLQSNKNESAVDGVLKVLKYGVIVSLVLTIIGIIVMAIILYIFLMMIFAFLSGGV